MAGSDALEHPELDAMLERVKLSRGSDDKLNSEELEKLEENFKDPEFRNLFVDYMKEISDPQYRREQEEYIKQMEAQQGPPAGKTVIWPTPHHVMKIKYTRPGPDEDVRRKVFVNIVSSEKIPKYTTSRPNSGEGINLGMPCATGPLRNIMDNQNKSCFALDVCFNPQTIFLAQQQAAVYDQLNDLAVQKSTEILQRDIANGVKVETYRHVIKGVKYKTGKQALSMLIPEDAFQKITPSTDIGGSSNGVIMEKQKKKTTGNVTNSLSKALKSTSLNNNAHDGDNRVADTCRADQNGIQRTLEKGFLNRSSKKKISKDPELGEEVATHRNHTERGPISNNVASTKKTAPGRRHLIEELGSGQVQSNPPQFVPSTITARYSVKEREIFDMADYCSEPTTACNQQELPSPNRRHCKELIYTVNIPEGANAKELKLDVLETQIKLSTSSGVILIDEKLRYPVFEDGGKAKYDKMKREVTVTLPVKIPPTSGMEAKPISRANIQEPAVSADINKGSDDVKDDEIQDTVEHKRNGLGNDLEPLRRKSLDHSRWLSSSPLKSEKIEFRDVPSSTIENQKRCCGDGTDSAESRERAGAVASSSAAWGKEENDSSNWEVLPENDNDEEFMACKTFLGPKTDKVFKLGQKGLGYYYDTFEWPPPFSWSEEHDTITILVNVASAVEESVDLQELEKEKSLQLYLRFRDKHGTRWGLKICPKEKAELGHSRINVSDNNVVLVAKKEVLGYWGSLQGSNNSSSTECNSATISEECQLPITAEKEEEVEEADKHDCNDMLAGDVNTFHDSLFENTALHESEEGGFLKNKRQFELE